MRMRTPPCIAKQDPDRSVADVPAGVGAVDDDGVAAAQVAQSVRILASLTVLQLLRRADVMARREVLPRAGHDDYARALITSRLR
jgi:hypothetical protein